MAYKTEGHYWDVKPLWGLDVSGLGYSRNGMTSAARAMTHWAEALLMAWLDTAKSPTKLVWSEGAPYRGTNLRSPVVEMIYGVSSYTPEERYQRQTAGMKAYREANRQLIRGRQNARMHGSEEKMQANCDKAADYYKENGDEINRKKREARASRSDEQIAADSAKQLAQVAKLKERNNAEGIAPEPAKVVSPNTKARLKAYKAQWYQENKERIVDDRKAKANANATDPLQEQTVHSAHALNAAATLMAASSHPQDPLALALTQKAALICLPPDPDEDSQDPQHLPTASLPGNLAAPAVVRQRAQMRAADGTALGLNLLEAFKELGEGPYSSLLQKCPLKICKAGPFENSVQLATHIYTHRGPTCHIEGPDGSTCGARLDNNNTAIRHNEAQHALLSLLTSTSLPQSTWYCRLCKAWMLTYHDITIHLSPHIDQIVSAMSVDPRVMAFDHDNQAINRAMA